MDSVETVLAEIGKVANLVDRDEMSAMEHEILRAKRVYLAGVGRSGLMIRAFANRLMHLGLLSNVVGDVTSPHSELGDLLLVGSGSGETDSLVTLAKRAKAGSLRLGLVSTSPHSTISRLADAVLVVPAQVKGEEGTSRQPMASTFEQSCMVLYDAMTLDLMALMGETGATMFERHADLE